MTRELRLRCAVLISGVLLLAPVVHAEKVRLSECPYPVQLTIRQNLLGGKVDKIKEIRISDHVLYIVEIDLKGLRDAKLYIYGDGRLRKILEEMRLKDLPAPVRISIEQLVRRRGQIEDIEREIIDGTVRYRVEIELPRQPDKTFVFEEDGSVSSDK